MNFDDFDPTEKMTLEMLDDFDSEKFEEDFLDELDDLEYQCRLQKDDDLSYLKAYFGGANSYFPYSRDEVAELNVERCLNGKVPVCCYR